jgi:NAD(P)-dependent dehydrogenase (short-subunit alcohol dehydrogenase family)
MQHPVSIVTGAGSGIGRSIARMLAEKGHHVVLVGRTEQKLAEASDELRAIGPGDVMIVPADVADSEQAASVVDQTIERFGRVDNLVNCAGVAPMIPIERTTEETLEQCFSINTFGPALLIVRCWPHFKKQKSGCVVNIGTMGSTDPFTGFFAYAASKSALDSLTRSVAREGRSSGIRSFSVNPGAVETRALRNNFSEKVVPPHNAMHPDVVAKVVVDCIEGQRPDDQGRCIFLPSP